MFSQISERKMLGVRGLLLTAWLILIASLFWDPVSIQLTEAGSGTPFQISAKAVAVQDHELVSTPYPMGARIFWTMAVPILPLFLMVFGHEAWRRICPLSFASQIPEYLNLRRQRTKLQRRTGRIDRQASLIDRNGWLARNTWYVQFGILFTGLTARLLLINSNRYALAAALLGVIAAAIVTGIIWGGKTWCNYFCPANVVQKIYTEPRGLLESSPHFTRPALPQSMCRKPTDKGDQSSCVACTVNCGDIDLQGSYWKGLEDPQRRNVYYMFFGLIVGFYGFYYVYAGNWDYYFSGTWTHEDNLLTKVLAPGLTFEGRIFAIPKLIVAPLTLAVACLASLGLGRLLEAIYRRIYSPKESDGESIYLHHCLSFSAWLSINTFYLFGGRPNLLLLTPLATRVVDILIIALTTLWLIQVLQMSPRRYEQEGMASRLLGELRKLKVDVTRFLDGRRLESLKPNEIFLLNKILPGFSHAQKLGAYRAILDEAVTSGTTASSATLRQLEELRKTMDVTEAEHQALLEQLGVSDSDQLDNEAISREEKRVAVENYQSILGSSLAARLAAGETVAACIADPAFQSTLQVLRLSLQISDADHAAALDRLTGEDGAVSARLREALDVVVRRKALRLCVEATEMSDALGEILLDILLQRLDVRDRKAISGALALLRNFHSGETGTAFAEELVSLTGDIIHGVLSDAAGTDGSLTFREALPRHILSAIENTARSAPNSRGGPLRKAVVASLDMPGNLEFLLQDEDPLLRALGLSVFAFADPDVAREAATRLADAPSATEHPLLTDVVHRLAGRDSGDTAEETAALRVTIRMFDRDDRIVVSDKRALTVGRAADNDIVIPDSAVWPYHASVLAQNGQVRLLRLDEGDIFVEGRLLDTESALLENSNVISLGHLGEDAPQIQVDWNSSSEADVAVQVQPILRLAMIARNRELREIPLEELADLAIVSKAERHTRGSRLRSVSGQSTSLLVHNGEVSLYDSPTATSSAEARLGPGDLVRSKWLKPGVKVTPEVTSAFAVLIRLPDEDKAGSQLARLLRVEKKAPDAPRGSARSRDAKVKSTRHIPS